MQIFQTFSFTVNLDRIVNKIFFRLIDRVHDGRSASGFDDFSMTKFSKFELRIHSELHENWYKWNSYIDGQSFIISDKTLNLDYKSVIDRNERFNWFWKYFKPEWKFSKCSSEFDNFVVRKSESWIVKEWWFLRIHSELHESRNKWNFYVETKYYDW